VRPGGANDNYGSDTTLRVYDSGTSSYLKIQTSDATHLFLTLTVTEAGNGGCAYAVADNSWSESTLTYNNRPALGAELDCHTAVQANGSQVTFDLGTVPEAGVYSFSLSGGGSDAIKYGSRESATPPEI
jgi:hypothetical protein